MQGLGLHLLRRQPRSHSRRRAHTTPRTFQRQKLRLQPRQAGIRDKIVLHLFHMPPEEGGESSGAAADSHLIQLRADVQCAAEECL